MWGPSTEHGRAGLQDGLRQGHAHPQEQARQTVSCSILLSFTFLGLIRSLHVRREGGREGKWAQPNSVPRHRRQNLSVLGRKKVILTEEA